LSVQDHPFLRKREEEKIPAGKTLRFLKMRQGRIHSVDLFQRSADSVPIRIELLRSFRFGRTVFPVCHDHAYKIGSKVNQ
jgi:hypothetical protein